MKSSLSSPFLPKTATGRWNDITEMEWVEGEAEERAWDFLGELNKSIKSAVPFGHPSGDIK